MEPDVEEKQLRKAWKALSGGTGTPFLSAKITAISFRLPSVFPKNMNPF